MHGLSQQATAKGKTVNTRDIMPGRVVCVVGNGYLCSVRPSVYAQHFEEHLPDTMKGIDFLTKYHHHYDQATQVSHLHITFTHCCNLIPVAGASCAADAYTCVLCIHTHALSAWGMCCKGMAWHGSCGCFLELKKKHQAFTCLQSAVHLLVQISVAVPCQMVCLALCIMLCHELCFENADQ